MNEENNTLAHTVWTCKYHIFFAPKYRRKAFYDSRRLEIGIILRDLCEWKGVNIIEAEVCVDHIHIAGDTSKDERELFYGTPEREKLTNDI